MTVEPPSTDLRSILQAITVSVVIQIIVFPLTIWLLLPNRADLAGHPGELLIWAFVAVIFVPVAGGLFLGRLTDQFFSPTFELTRESLQAQAESAPLRITRLLARL